MFGEGYVLGSIVTALGLFALKKYKEICAIENM